MFAIWVVENGRSWWVGDRPTRVLAQESADAYNRDPIQRGWFYVIRKVTS